MKKLIVIMGCVLIVMNLLMMLVSVTPADAQPHFGVYVNTHGVYTWGWDKGVDVTLTIYNESGGVVFSSDPATAPPDGQGFGIDYGDNSNVQPGYLVTLTGGTTTTHHVVTSLTMTEANPVTDTISGTAAPDSEVLVYAKITHFQGSDTSVEYTTTTAEGGNWSVEILEDLIPGEGVEALQLGENGNSTNFEWDPTFNVLLSGDVDVVWTWGWPADANITLTIDDPTNGDGDDFTYMATAPPDGDGFGIDLIGCNVQPGYLVTLSDGITSVPHTVTNLSVTYASAVTGIVKGTVLEPGAKVYVTSWSDLFEPQYVIADDEGNWITNPISPHDLYQGGRANQHDQVDNSTQDDWQFLPEIVDLLDSFDEAVANSLLTGDGRGGSAEHRLNAFRNMLQTAIDFFDGGLFEDACQQLQDAYNRCDGDSPPPDFVTGPGAPALADMILDWMNVRGCE